MPVALRTNSFCSSPVDILIRRYLDRQHLAVAAAYVVRLRFANGRQYAVVLGPDPHRRIARTLERRGGIDNDGRIAELRRLGRALRDRAPDIWVGVGAGGRHVDVVGVKIDRLYVHRLPLKGGVAPRGARLVCARIGRGIPLAAREEPVVCELVAAEAELGVFLDVAGVCGVDRVLEAGVKAGHDHIQLVGCSRHLAAVPAPEADRLGEIARENDVFEYEVRVVELAAPDRLGCRQAADERGVARHAADEKTQLRFRAIGRHGHVFPRIRVAAGVMCAREVPAAHVVVDKPDPYEDRLADGMWVAVVGIYLPAVVQRIRGILEHVD